MHDGDPKKEVASQACGRELLPPIGVGDELITVKDFGHGH